MVIFRYIDGICRPLDIDNVEEERLFENQHENFCRPTKCPKCGSSVFFIRHNGGSVWIDSLGYPWPKHLCFDKLRGYRDIEILKSVFTKNTDSLLGLVFKIDVKDLDTKIVIRCNDNKIRYYLLGGRQRYLLGQIVTMKTYSSFLELSTLKNGSIQKYEIPSVKRSNKPDIVEKNSRNVSKRLKRKNKIENQKLELKKQGVAYNNEMTSKDLRELLKNETERRRNLNISSLIEQLNELKVHLTGNESYVELRQLKRKNIK